MPCYHPLDAWVHTSKKTEGGKDLILFSYHPATCARTTPDFQVPCGRCVGCKLGKSREWSVRCMHEASLYWRNCWLTLTLNDDYRLTRDNPYSLEKGPKSEFTRFLKRLRNKFGEGIRYYYCGEYGETCFFCNKSEKDCYSKGCGNYYPWRGRPHYHVCLFNHDFDDKLYFKTINGCHHYTSDTLDKLWTDPDTGLNMGWATISDLTPDSAAYTARYSLKKITGDLAEEDDPITHIKHYQRIMPSGMLVDLVPEYTNMSRMPGIGKGWLDLYSKEVLDNDAVLFKECRIKPPRFYDLKLVDVDPFIVDENKFKRIDKAKNSVDNTPIRLETREYITLQRTSSLHRKEI
ncbi:replication associated protein [Microviridae sp.]|nr:replication associated protein [Microviridae sp.]